MWVCDPTPLLYVKNMALARRHVLPAIREPPYEVNDVPRARYTGQGSAAQFVSKREDWLAMLGETVLVSNRAEEDFERKLVANGDLVLHPGKPLSLEYLADRIDTDDPMWGYTVRTEKEGWMQGYITLTTFTTWLKWFRFDSLCEASAVVPYTLAQGEEKVQQWWDDRLMDGDGRLARALNRQIRDGDWTDEGVIWPHVAEVSLLAGLGCGGLLLDAALEELFEKRDANGDRQYEYVVVQATENAVPFYESRGFIRVGAVARYEERVPSSDYSLQESSSKKSKKSSKKQRQQNKSSRKRKTFHQDDEYVEDDDDDEEHEQENNEQHYEEAQPAAPQDHQEGQLTGTWSPCIEVKAHEGDTPKKMAKRYAGVRASDIVFLNRRKFGEEFDQDSKLIAGTETRIPKFSKFDQKKLQGQGSRIEPVEPLRLKTGQLKDLCCNASVASAATAEEITEKDFWYSTSHESVPRVASRLKVTPEELVALNKCRYPDLKVNSNLHPGSMLLIPRRPVDLNRVYEIAGENDIEEEQERRREELVLAREEAKDATLRDFYCATTTANSTSVEGVLTKPLSDVMAYRHWTFPDELVSLTSPSYMMALPLNKKYLDKYVPSFKSGHSALQQLQEMSNREYPIPPFNYVDASTTTETVEANETNNAEEESTNFVNSSALLQTHEFQDTPLHIRVAVKSKCIKAWRVPVGETEQGTRVFVRGMMQTQRIPAELTRALKPRPPEPPTVPLAPLREYVRQVRPDVMRKYPHLSRGEAVKVCEVTWKNLEEEERAPYLQQAQAERKVYNVLLRQYFVDLAAYHKQYGLDDSVYDLSNPDQPRLRVGSTAACTPLAKKLKRSADGQPPIQQMLSVNALGPGYRKLMNKVVTLRPKPNEPNRKRWLENQGKEYKPQGEVEFYYALTYIPDLQWCRLVPLRRAGVFQRGASKKRDYERHVGRTRWMLAPENEGGEIDVSAERCVPVWKAYSTRNVQDADKEEWDIYETNPQFNPSPAVMVEASSSPLVSSSTTPPAAPALPVCTNTSSSAWVCDLSGPAAMGLLLDKKE